MTDYSDLIDGLRKMASTDYMGAPRDPSVYQDGPIWKAADAIEAQAAKIAELEALIASLRSVLGKVSSND